MKEKLFFFLWRPRPRDVLTADMKKTILKNLKKYEKIFEREDRLRLEESNKEILAQRRKMAEDMSTIIRRNRQYNASIKHQRVKSRNGYDSDDEKNYHIDVQVSD
jgi:translation initiation factor 3 subunit B